MKNNINQIARHTNTIKGFDGWAEDALQFIASEVDKAKNILTHSNHE